MKPFAALVAASACLLLTFSLSADDRDSLRDVEELDVVIENVPDALRETGLSAGQLKTDVELKLRLAEIVVSEQADSYLYVNLNGVRSGDYLYAYSIRVTFKQPAMLLRSAEKSLHIWETEDMRGLLWRGIAGRGVWKGVSSRERMGFDFEEVVGTWGSGMIGTVGTSRNPRNTIRDALRDVLDEFVNDFLAAKQEQEKLERILKELDDTEEVRENEASKDSSNPDI